MSKSLNIEPQIDFSSKWVPSFTPKFYDFLLIES